MAIPKNMYTSATTRPKPETGTMSPYPTVVTVAMHHHKASKTVFICVLGNLDSRPVHQKSSYNYNTPCRYQ